MMRASLRLVFPHIKLRDGLRKKGLRNTKKLTELELPIKGDEMIKHGCEPFLECSTKGDKRFSAFCARIRGRGMKSIEEIYQAAKIFEDGSTGMTWKEAKGRQAVNADELAIMYSQLWDEYIDENPHLLEVLRIVSGVSDMFGQRGHVCQATELWRIKFKFSGFV